MNAAAALRPVLAVHTSTAVRTAKFPVWPHFSEDEIEAVAQVMRSGRVNYTTGEQGRAFEQEFAHACGTKHAVAVANGTLALELALRCVGIGCGDQVITSSRTFVATASCIAMVGATPIFADVDRNTQNITVDTIRALLTPQTRAVIAVHLGGNPCDMDSLSQFARERNLLLIEDCAQAQGARYRGRLVGSFGDAAAFSFCNDKIISSLGEGGMVATNSRELWARAAAFRDHGTKPDALSDPANGNGFRWIHDSLGTNWRMSEAHAAVGRMQLKKASDWLKRRRALASILYARLGQIPALRIPPTLSHIEPAYYRFYAFVRPEKLRSGWNRDSILQAMSAASVPCFSGSCGEVYLEKALAASRPAERRAVARELGESSLAFPVHPTLSDADVQDICNAVARVMEIAS